MTVAVRCGLRAGARGLLVVAPPEVRRILQCLLDAAGKPEWDVGCWLTTDRTVARLNRQYRHKRGPTDILSFAFHELPRPEAFPHEVDPEDHNLGDMVVSTEYVRRVCATQRLDEAAHYRTLLAHGVAHLLGHDHETDAQYAAMAQREAILLEHQRRVLPPPQQQQQPSGTIPPEGCLA